MGVQEDEQCPGAESGVGGCVEGLIQQLCSQRPLPDLGVPGVWGTLGSKITQPEHFELCMTMRTGTAGCNYLCLLLDGQ